jgi:hypothetical protein
VKAEAPLLLIADQYPPTLRARQKQDVKRIAYHVAVVLDCLAACAKRPPECSVMDVGGDRDVFAGVSSSGIPPRCAG